MTLSAIAKECAHCGSQQPDAARFCNHCGARLIADSDERRALAVLFCDIVGSTNYLRKLGPEDWLSILRDFHETTSRVVLQFGGYVAQHLGDGQLVYFGFPEAHDDDARRAVETALGIIGAMADLNARLLYRGWPELRVRIGISTGRTLVGSVGSGSEALAHGEIPHLAARLQSMAEPNTILIDQATHRLVEGFFRCQLVEGKTPKDFPQIALHVVLGRTGARTRLDVSTIVALSPFVGRASQVQALATAWDESSGGTRRNVVIRAEAGMGKTRLLQTFRTQLEAADHVFECRASPYYQNRALYPIVDMLERSLGIQPDEPNERRLGKLERWLSGSSALGLGATALFAPFFSVKVASDRAQANLSPQRQRQIVFQSLFNWFEFLGKRGTVLFILEDAHWADPSSLEFLDSLIKSESNSRLLLVITARPDFQNPWPDRCSELTLDRLPDSDTEQIVASIVPASVVPTDLLRFVLKKADGVPLFAEELTKTLVEAGVLAGGRDSTRCDSALLSQLEIPSPLSGVLTARLDRLGRAKQTAQLAATLGREFRLDILSAVSSAQPEVLTEDFGKLIDAGLVFLLANDTYAFKHALIRDAAYDLTSTQARQRVHARIASTLEERFPDIVNGQPDLLAFHHAAADQRAFAVRYAQRAAEHALQRCAYSEAIAHASNAIAWAEALESSAHAEAELAANGVLSQAAMATRGWADAEVEAIARRSAALLRQVDPFNRHRVPTLWSLFAYHHTASHRRAAHEIARELVAVADASCDQGLCAAAATMLGITLHMEGNMSGAGRALERAIQLYDPKLHREQGPQMGLDSLVLAKTLLAHLRWSSCDSASAFSLVTTAIKWAREVGHVPSIAIGLLYGCQIYQLAGDKGTAAAMTEEILTLAQKYGLPAYEGYAAIMHAWATRDEKRAEAIVDGLTSMGCNVGLSYWASLVADNLAERRFLDAAVERIEQCLSICQKNDEHYYEAELCRRRGIYQLQRHQGPTDGARASLERAIDLASRQEMPRIEALAIRDLLVHFGEREHIRTRFNELLALYPGLHDLEMSNHIGVAE
jgi:TOMM system kinase/cyclase fusion protein